MSTDQLTALWDELGWMPTPQQLQLFSQLQAELRQWNSRLNLTRLVEGDDFWIAQVFDSLWPLAGLLRSHQQGGDTATPLRIVDVGTGGGFPGLALAIALPSAQLSLVDSVQRKIDAVRAMAMALGLTPRLTFCSDRIEKLGRTASWRNSFDWAVARAVAPAPVVAEYLVPLLNNTGQALLYRGQWSPADHQQLAAAAHSLNAQVKAVEARELPGGRGQRHAITLAPRAACPRQYPRPVGIPAKQPLGSPSGGARSA